MIVIDASAAIDLLLDLDPHADTIRRRVREESPGLLSVHLLDAEVGQVLRRYARAGTITKNRAEAALDDLGALPITRYAHTPLLRRAFELRSNVTFYDALYVALAEAVRAPVLTRDAALGRALGRVTDIEVVE